MYKTHTLNIAANNQHMDTAPGKKTTYYDAYIQSYQSEKIERTSEIEGSTACRTQTLVMMPPTSYTSREVFKKTHKFYSI